MLRKLKILISHELDPSDLQDRTHEDGILLPQSLLSPLRSNMAIFLLELPTVSYLDACNCSDINTYLNRMYACMNIIYLFIHSGTPPIGPPRDTVIIGRRAFLFWTSKLPAAVRRATRRFRRHSLLQAFCSGVISLMLVRTRS